MKIKKIEIINNPVFGNIVFNFLKPDGSFMNYILFVGENGSGKTTLLNMIYNITNLGDDNPNLSRNEVRKFYIFDEFNNRDLLIILDSNKKNNIVILDKNIDLYAIVENSNSNDILANNGYLRDYEQHVFVEENGIYNEELTRQIISKNDRGNINLFSNFIMPEINDIGLEHDLYLKNNYSYTIEGSAKANGSLSEMIKGLLISLSSADNEDVVEFIKNNSRRVVPKNLVDKRINILKSLINDFFGNNCLQFLGVKKFSPIFLKGGSVVDLNKLSLGEREIIYKGGFLLMNVMGGSQKITLIDEPELGLHPRWQMKIFNYYKNILLSSGLDGVQQMFVTTHSPYVLQGAYNNFDGIIFFPSGKLINDLKCYFGDKPSLAVINYIVYNIPSIELHDELYGYIMLKSGKSDLKNLEKYFKDNGLDKTKTWVHEYYEKGKLKKREKTKDCSLQTFIRNKIHHPENLSMRKHNFNDCELKISIDQMLDLIDRLAL